MEKQTNKSDVPFSYMAVPCIAKSKVLFTTPQRIITNICEREDVPIDILKSRTRLKKYCELRHVIIYLINENFAQSLQECGNLFNRDHATVLHSKKFVNEKLEIGDEAIFKLYHRCFNYIKKDLQNNQEFYPAKTKQNGNQN